MRWSIAWRSAGGLAVAAIVVVLLAGAAGEDPAQARIEALMEQLGAASYAEREAASRALEGMAEPILPQVRRKAETANDLEVKQRLRAVARTIMLEASVSRATGMELALLEPGVFEMGSPIAERGRQEDELLHRVRITRPFLIGRNEVTQTEYRLIMANEPSWFARTGGGRDKVSDMDTRPFPVERVSWYDAIEFCNRLSELEGYPPYYKLAAVKRASGAIQTAQVTIVEGNGYRLPTEAEWEYACRSGTTTPFHFGMRSTGREANVKSEISVGAYGSGTRVIHLQRTAAVESYPPNRWGLFDMHGNAGEWCWDWYDRDYYKESPRDDPQGPERGRHRVVRGGSWLLGDATSRAASRFFLVPEERNYQVGFRVARTP